MELTLRGEGLVLRRPSPADAAAMVQAVRESQPEIGRFLAWATIDYGPADADQWCSVDVNDTTSHPLHVFDEHGRLLGGVGLHSADVRNGKVELGYWTRASARGAGVAVRSARLLVRCAFDVLGYSRVELLIATDNVASQRVADKLGATCEGRLRDRLRLPHGLVDAYVYSLIKRQGPG
ncbi:MAG: GNAT family N-acetyltransferase [Acidimicrobiia bacterium]